MSKVLFVIPSANVGGSVTSLINMIDLLKENGITVDLLLMSHTGALLQELENIATLLPENRILAAATCKKEYLKSHYGWKGVAIRTVVAMGNRFRIDSINNLIYHHAADKLIEYDVVVAYQECLATDFAYHINTKQKVAWVHTMFDKFMVAYASINRIAEIYKAYNQIVCVADSAAYAFVKELPQFSYKVHVIPNPLLPAKIILQSKEPVEDEQVYFDDTNTTYIVSVGRLSPEKQYTLALEVALRLKNLGKPYRWYLIGDGPEKQLLMAKIREYKLDKHVYMTGLLLNPYPIIQKADLLVITSVYEAQPMVGNEALILNVPVITTDYPTAHSLVKNHENGIICQSTPESLSNAIVEYMDHPEVKSQLKTGANNFVYSTDKIIDDIKKIMQL